jgi:hypothetical protein
LKTILLAERQKILDDKSTRDSIAGRRLAQEQREADFEKKTKMSSDEKRKNGFSALSKTEDVKANTSNVDAKENRMPKMVDNNLMQEPKYGPQKNN